MTDTPLSRADNRYGAQMGRGRRSLTLDGAVAVVSGVQFTGKVSLRHIKLDSGGYDSGGAYWGAGQALYWAGDDTAVVDMWFRARDRDAAKAHVLASHPTARFYR